MRCLRCGQMITESYSHNKAEHPLCIRCMIKEGKALIKENEEEFGNLSNLPKLNGEQTFERDTFIDILNNFIALEGCKATLLFSPTSIKKDVVFNNKTDLANTRFETYIELLNCPASIEETQDGYTIVVDTSELEFTEEDIDAFVNDLVQPDGDVVYEAASTIDELNDELNKVMREFVAEVNDDKKEYDRQDLERIQNAYFDKIEKVIFSTTAEVSFQSIEEVVNAVRDEMESIMNKYPEYSEYQNRNYFGAVTEAMLEDAQYDMDIEDANERLNSLIKDMREYVKTERESGCPDKEIIRLIKSTKKGFTRQLTLILDRSHLSQEDESKARKAIENMMNTLEFKDSNILESKDFKYSDEDEVEYKGYTIAPFTINNIKVGNKSVGGFTKYFIKKGDAYYKDKDFTSVEDAKKFIDSAIKGMRTVLASELKKGDVILDNKNKPYKITSIDYEDGYVSLYADNLTEIGNARFTFDNDEVVILRDSSTKVKESIEYDFEDITNMSDAKIILKKYGIDLIKKDSRNYVLRKDGKEYTFYVLDNPNEVRKDLVKAVNKLTETNANIDEAYREPVDDLAVRELVLYIKNDSQIYNTCTMAVVKNLARKKSKGVYDKDLAVKAFEYVAKAGANKYTKEFGGTFNPATRNAVAKELLNEYEDYIEELSNKKKVEESIDYTDENYLYIPYWYLTKHGMGPGSVPPKMSIWTWFETPEGTYFASSKVLNMQELKEYEIVEKHPRLEDIPEKSRVDIQDFLEEPISDEDKNIVAKENLNIKEDLSDNQYEMIEELADKITNYNGAEYRGAKIPSPQRGYINQSNLDDELRLKYIDYEINDNNIAISYITQGPFEYHQGKQIEKEIIRATNYWVSKLGIDFPITLDIDVVCRDGAHYGHYNNSVKVENGIDVSKLKEDYEVMDTYYMVDIDSDIKADSATKQEAIDIVNKAKSSVKDYVYVTRATTYFRDGREEKSFEDVIDAYIKDGKWVVKKDMLGLLKQTESFKVVDKNGKKVPQGGGFTSRKEAEMFAAQYGEKDLKVVKESTIKTSKNTLKSLDEDWGYGYAYLRLYVYSGEDQEVELGIDEFHYNSDFKVSQKNKAIAQAKKFVSDFNNNKINDDRLKTPFYVAVKYIEYDDEEDDFEADDIYIINSNGKELTESIGESYKDKPMSYEQAKKYLKDKRNIDLTKDMYQDIMALAGVKKLKESYSQSVSFWDWANSVARSEGTLITPVSKEADNLLQDGEDEDYVNESDLPKLKSIVDEFSYYLYDNKREQNVYAIANGQIYFSYDRVLYMNKKDADYFAKNYDLVVNKATVNFDDLMVEDTNESFGIGLPESKEEK